MNPEPVLNFLSSITELSAQFRIALTADLKQERYSSRQVIKSEGQRENRLWFIHEGIARSYFFDENGIEHTIHFWNSGEIVFSFAGYWKEPSPNYIELLEPSHLYSISYRQLTQLLGKFPEANTLLKITVRRYYLMEYRRKRLYSLPSDERYRILKRESPFLFKKVSVRMIASYLNMSRENLSRIISRRHD